VDRVGGWGGGGRRAWGGVGVVATRIAKFQAAALLPEGSQEGVGQDDYPPRSIFTILAGGRRTISALSTVIVFRPTLIWRTGAGFIECWVHNQR